MGEYFSASYVRLPGWIRRDGKPSVFKMDAARRGIRDPGVPQLMDALSGSDHNWWDALLFTCWFSEKARKLLPGISLKSIKLVVGNILTQQLNNDQLEVHSQHRWYYINCGSFGNNFEGFFSQRLERKLQNSPQSLIMVGNPQLQNTSFWDISFL